MICDVESESERKMMSRCDGCGCGGFGSEMRMRSVIRGVLGRVKK